MSSVAVGCVMADVGVNEKREKDQKKKGNEGNKSTKRESSIAIKRQPIILDFYGNPPF